MEPIWTVEVGHGSGSGSGYGYGYGAHKSLALLDVFYLGTKALGRSKVQGDHTDRKTDRQHM